MIFLKGEGRFSLGRVVITTNAQTKLTYLDISNSLQRHFRGDWGDIDEDDRKSNDEALTAGERLLSVYHARSGVKFWVITEADRSATTILLPEDY